MILLESKNSKTAYLQLRIHPLSILSPPTVAAEIRSITTLIIEAMQAPYAVWEQPLGEPTKLKIICIGAGITGLNLVYQTRRHLKNVDLVLYEKNNTIGGTWFENRWV